MARAGGSNDEQAIRSLIDEWAAAVRRRDIGGVIAHHDVEILLFDVVPPLQSMGITEYRRGWEEQFFPWSGANGRFELKDIRITAGTDVAFATGLIECAGTEHGKRVEFTLRLTLCFRKRGGEWLFVHEHHSEPLADRP